jgi:hypothetical protein
LTVVAVIPTSYVAARRGGYGGVPLALPDLQEAWVLAGVAAAKKMPMAVPFGTELVYDCGSRSESLGRYVVVAELVSQPHPILGCAQTISALVTKVRDAQPVYMAPADKRAALLALNTAARQLAELNLRVIAASADVAEEDGARDIAGWLAPRIQADSPAVRADQRLAQALDSRWSKVAAGMAAGVVSPDQARVIVHGLEALPDHLGAEIVTQAEAQLVEYAKEFAPAELRKLARRILDVVAPEIAEAEEAKLLEKEEQHAREKTSLRTRRLGDGTSRTTIVYPDADADRLHTYLDAFTSPRKHDDAVSGEEDRIPHHRKLGHAFCALLEHLNPDKLPDHGGDATTVMVTIDLDSLRSELGTGAIVGGEPLSATAIRRLACTANIIPVVLGGNGEILDLGRSRRLYSPAQRKAIRLRDQHCRGEGCTVPAAWSEVHHLKPWSEGGNTDLKDGILYCNFHHHRAHDPNYEHEILPNGDIRFHRRR